jgi:RNA polymerase sigma factor (sigma-70 family)
MIENKEKYVEGFFKTEYKKLLNFVKKNFDYRLSGDSPEDILQEVSLNLIDKLNLDLQVENFAAYMYRSLKNKIIDNQRKSTSKPIVDSYDKSPSANLHIQSVIDEPEFDIVEKTGIDYEELQEGLSQLKPDEQELIILTELEGKSFAELSEKWNVPIGTLLSRKHRALAKLSKLVKEKSKIKTIQLNDYGNRKQLEGKRTQVL